jgi:hypothetical protein
VLGGFAAVHDARRNAVEAARTAANVAMDRDLRAAGITGFRLDGCWPAESACPELRALSPATQAVIQRYLAADERYVAWTDLGNITGRGWTPAERQDFLQAATIGAVGALGQNGVERLQDMPRSPSWDLEESHDDMVQEDVGAAAAARLDGFLSEMRRPSDETTRTEEVQVPHPAAGPAAERALQALARQGRAVDELNRVSSDAPERAPYEDDFAARVGQEAGRLNAEQHDSDAAAREFYRGMNRDADRLRGQLEALRALRLQPPPLPAPPTPASPRVDGSASSARRSAEPKDHCPGGAFKCPNNLPWPRCSHAEKYRCPPPEHAAEAARHRASEADSTSKPPVPEP